MKASVKLPVKQLIEVVALLRDEETLNLLGISEQEEESDVSIKISREAMVLSAETQYDCSSQKKNIDIIINIRTLCIETEISPQSIKNLLEIYNVLGYNSGMYNNEKLINTSHHKVLNISGNPNTLLEQNLNGVRNTIDINLECNLVEHSNNDKSSLLESEYPVPNISTNKESTTENKAKLEPSKSVEKNKFNNVRTCEPLDMADIAKVLMEPSVSTTKPLQNETEFKISEMTVAKGSNKNNSSEDKLSMRFASTSQNKPERKTQQTTNGAGRNVQSSVKKEKANTATRASKRKLNDIVNNEKDSVDELGKGSDAAREVSGEPVPKRKYNRVKKKEPSLPKTEGAPNTGVLLNVGRFQCKICEVNYVKEVERDNHILRTHKMVLNVYENLTEDQIKEEAEVTRKKIQVKFEEKQKNPEANSTYRKDSTKQYPAIPCNLCPYKASMRWLLNHMYKAHKDHPDYKKELCTLDQHRSNQRKSKNTKICLKCPFCQLEFFGARILQHMKKFHKDDDYFQENIELIYKEVRSLQQKMPYKRNNMSCECDQCGREFLRKADLNRHVRLLCKFTVDKPEIHKCRHCSYYSSEALFLENHMQKRHGKDQAFICDICGAKFNRQLNLTAHMRFKHTDCCWWTCQKCNKQFDVKSSYNEHVLRCQSEVRPHSCKQCTRSFKVKTDLNKHVKIVHCHSYRYRCEKCNHGVMRKAYLETHQCGRVRRVDPDEKVVLKEPYRNNEKEKTFSADNSPGNENYSVNEDSVVREDSEMLLPALTVLYNHTHIQSAHR